MNVFVFAVFPEVVNLLCELPCGGSAWFRVPDLVNPNDFDFFNFPSLSTFILGEKCCNLSILSPISLSDVILDTLIKITHLLGFMRYLCILHI